MRLIFEFWSVCKTHKGGLIFSLISSVLLIIATYFTNNLPLFTGENLNQFFFTEYSNTILGNQKIETYDDVIFINTSYDGNLVPAYEDNYVVGNSKITDRKKLYDFLKLLSKSNCYKYIILDVVFAKDDCSEYDDSLFTIINKMDKIVVAHQDSIVSTSKIKSKRFGLAQFYSTIVATNFCRYEFIDPKDGRRYIPTKVYEDLYPHRTLVKHGWNWLSFYTSNGKLCNNSAFLLFHVNDPISKFNAESDNLPNENSSLVENNVIEGNELHQVYYNLGFDLMDNYQSGALSDEQFIEYNIEPLMRNKYVIICDYKGDLHDTYCGLRPGGLIIYKALKYLEEGKHYVDWFHTFLWMLICFVISICLYYNLSILSVFGRSCTKHKFLYLLSDILSFTIVLLVCEIFFYVVTDTVHSLIIPIIYFSCFKIYQSINHHS